MRAVLTTIFVILCVFLLAPEQPNAAQQYTCSLQRCTCIGKSDCVELLGSGWCKGKLKCGTDAGLPPDKCKCSVLKVAPKGQLRPGVDVQPTMKAR